jgi:P22 coat protein - gene protein 5
MATNTFKTLNDGDITREALRILKNSNGVIKKVNRQYDASFGATGAKNGGTLNIRLPNRYVVTSGRTATTGGENTTETSTALVVATQKHVSMGFFSSELTLSLDDFSSRYLKPAMSVLASTIASDVCVAMQGAFVNYVGTPGTTPSSFLTYSQAGERLDWQTAPRDGNRAVILSPTAMAATVDAQKGLFHSGPRIADQYESGIMEAMTGFDFIMDQSVQTLTAGARTTAYLTNGSPALTSGTAIVNLDTGTGAMVVGDQFTIAGLFEVNPDTKQSTGILKVFTVATANAGGTQAVALSQTIYTSGPYQNISGAVTDGLAVSFIGTLSTAYPRNLAFHRDSTVLATADLELPKGVDMASRASMDGLSLRFVRQYDATTDNFLARFDILYGTKVVRPEWGAVVYG